MAGTHRCLLRESGIARAARDSTKRLVTSRRTHRSVDCLFAETERFHQGDGDLIDQLMDRIRGFGGDVTWERLRAKGLNRWQKANARARHFGEVVSNLIANAEGELVNTTPLTWRR